jgi:hypothetical protein
MTRPLLAVAALAALGALSSCGTPDPAYVQTDYRYHQRGEVQVCYNDQKATPELVQSMADDICKQYDRRAELWLQQKYQCSWSAPTLATFYCRARPGENPPPLVSKKAPMRHDPSLPAY